jgi:hypothetical protein
MLCSQCGSNSNPDARFCGTCGVSLTSSTVATPGQRKGFEWAWPPVDTPQSARFAVRQAFWGALFVCGAAAVFTFISMTRSGLRLPIGPAALVDAAFFGVIAFGIWKESRLVTVAAWTVFVLAQFYTLIVSAPRTVSGLFLFAALLLAFMGAIRGTLALHEMRDRGFD